MLRLAEHILGTPCHIILGGIIHIQWHDNRFHRRRVARTQYIVSKRAHRLMVHFMAVFCGKSQRNEERTEHVGREPADFAQLTKSGLSLQRVHGILREAATWNSIVREGLGENNSEDEMDKTMHASQQVQAAVRMISMLWGVESLQWSGNAVDTSGHLKPLTSKWR